MRQVKISIQKLTIVPTKYQAKHKFRADWKLIKKIDYGESSYYFNKVGGENSTLNILYDAQLAKWLKDNFGEGRYQIFIWSMGHKGWTMLKFACDKDSFKQHSKNKKISLKQKYFVLTKRLKKETDEHKIEKIKEKMEDMEFDLELDPEEIEELQEDKGYKKIQLIKNISSLEKMNEYMSYGIKLNNTSSLEIGKLLINRERGGLL